LEPRLRAGIWVAAYLARLRSEAVPAFVVHRGDEDAGAVLVVVSTLDGRSVARERSFDLMTGARAWITALEGTDAEVAAHVARARARDPDLWVIEVEDREGRAFLDPQV
jgi:hypothetical protein